MKDSIKEYRASHNKDFFKQGLISRHKKKSYESIRERQVLPKFSSRGSLLYALLCCQISDHFKSANAIGKTALQKCTLLGNI